MRHPRSFPPMTEGGAAPSPPSVEIVTHTGDPAHAGRQPWYRAPRLRLFVLVSLLVLIPGLAWDFLRPPRYQATASLLTAVAPPSAPAGTDMEADVEHVAIQRQVLLGRDLLMETLRLLEQRGASDIASPHVLGSMLTVESLPGTNLVELRAQGPDPDLLAVVVNAWIDGYRHLRRRMLENELGARRRALEEELAALNDNLEARRQALDGFRAEQDIVTLERDGNEALARLSALTAELNRVRDEVVEAEARAASIREAVAQGHPVVPPGDEANLEQLEDRAAELRARLIELEKRFTPLYLENEPDLRVIPAQLQAIEAEIARKRERGAATMLALAEQEVAQARRRVEVLEAELAGQKEDAGRFTTAFARYQAMEEEVAGLEEMQRGLKSRLLQLEVRGLERYPPVQVVEAAHPPASAVAPAYWRDAGWVVLAALGAGLAAILLLEFLTRRPGERARPVPVTGVRVFAGAPAGEALAQAPGGPWGLEQPQGPAVTSDERPSLPGTASLRLPRELIAAEVGALWSLADPLSRELVALLLSGLTPEECAGLEPEHFDLEAAFVRTPLGPGREVPLAGPVRDLFAACRPLPMWAGGGGRLGVDELAVRIGLLAHDAGLAQPKEVTPEALRHTYVAYLVRQGARLTELERVIGPTAPSRLATYMGLAPAGPAKCLGDLNLVYPLFQS